MIDRAAQFSPFAALTGYGEVIKETARLTDRKPELSESEKAELDYKLQMACDYPGEKPALTITYFVQDQRKAGGSYHTISGQIKKIDDYQKQVILMDKTRIDVDCILDIDGQIYEIANSHFLRTAGPHFPDSQGHIKRTVQGNSRAGVSRPC